MFFGPSTNQFAGADPGTIKRMLRQNLSTLVLHPADPVEVAAKFYQRFVYIHPFNDGNGRIARFIVEVYLIYYQHRVDFERLRKTTRWLNQLNYCHRKLKTNAPEKAYDHSLKWWAHHFRKFVAHEDELKSYEQPEANSQKNSIYERQLRIFFLCNALCNSCVIVPRKQGNLAEEKSIAGAKAVLLLSTISTSSE